MRINAVLLSAVLAFAAALASAQQMPSTNPSGKTAATASTNEPTATSSTTVQGCLTGTSGNYMLTNSSGMTYQLQGDESQLSANLNKEVAATGTLGTRASASATNSPDTTAPSSAQQGEASASAGNATGTASGGTATAHASRTLEITSIRKISDTCSLNK